MEQIIYSIIQTLNGVEVKGKENVEKMYCSIVALENLIVEIQKAQADIAEENNKKEGEKIDG